MRQEGELERGLKALRREEGIGQHGSRRQRGWEGGEGVWKRGRERGGDRAPRESRWVVGVGTTSAGHLQGQVWVVLALDKLTSIGLKAPTGPLSYVLSSYDFPGPMRNTSLLWMTMTVPSPHHLGS